MAQREEMLPGYRGHVDAIEPTLSGWVSEIARPGVPVSLALRLDRHHRIAAIADRARPDVAAAGLAASDCGFSLPLPAGFLDGAEHRVDLLLSDGRSLNLPGMPERVALGPVPADLVAGGAVSVECVLDLLRQNDFEAGLDASLVCRENAVAFNSLRAPDQGFVWYARAGGRLVGYGRLDRGRGEAKGLGVVALTVLAAYRRKGLGEALLRALLRAAAEAGSVRQVWLSVRPDNAPAVHLYRKLGFVRDAKPPSGPWAVPGETTMVWMPR